MSTSDELRELETALQIDRDDLDRCLVEQPGLFHQVAKAVAIALSERNELKLALEKAKAEADRQVRETAIKNSEKLTETALSKRILLVPTIQKLKQQLLQAKQQADLTLALMAAFQHKLYMLEALLLRRESRQPCGPGDLRSRPRVGLAIEDSSFRL
jgi:hypothetical protein